VIKLIICVVGPTGVGKTKLSIELAKKYNAVVINADACQIYREMNIGTAKVTKEEKEGVPHFLFDIKNPDEEYTVYDYQKDLRELLYRYSSSNIIIVGGSGLYLTAGLYDYEFSEKEIKELDSFSNEELFDMCKNINEDVDIHPNNRRRLENYIQNKDHSTKEPKLLYDVHFIGLTTDRDTLYDRINLRVDKMFEQGLIEEVRNLKNKYGKTKILNSAIGYKEIIDYIDEKISLEEAVKIIETIKQNSRHYAKRQYTWFENKQDVKWFNTDYNNFNNTINEVIKYIEGQYGNNRK
jgi:tRNA dimethylallyltransferase